MYDPTDKRIGSKERFDLVVASILLRWAAKEARGADITDWELDPEYQAAKKQYEGAKKRYMDSVKE
jgi:hypothetical protein